MDNTANDIAMDLFGKEYLECTIMEQKAVDERWGEVHSTDEMA